MEDRVMHAFTMYGFEQTGVDPHDTVPGRTLKSLLRTHLPELQPRIQARLEQAFAHELEGRETTDGWKSVSAFALAERVTGQINNQVLVGDQLASNQDFSEAAMRYSHDVVIAMEICRHIPAFLVPWIAPAIMAWSGAMEKVASYLTPLVEERLRQSNQGGMDQSKFDCIRWVIESSHTKKQRTVKRLVQQMIALIFASAHQMPMVFVFAIYNLCAHPEYIQPLREEIETSSRGPSREKFKNMPLLDSFLRESARLNPLDALSIQRKVMEPFTFSDGSYVPAGNVVCVPQQALMRDARYYRDPAEFDGFRFVVQEDGKLKSAPKLTDMIPSFPFWGASKKACPGRFYVSGALRQILAHFLTAYDFRLADADAPRTFVWTTAVVPRYSVALLLRERIR